MGSSYTWCNFIRATPFLSHRFLRDLTVEKNIKIQFYTQLFKLYLSATIKEYTQKNQSIKQYTNTSITDKIIYKFFLVILEHKLVY